MMRTARRWHGKSAADGSTTVGVAVVFDVSDDGGAVQGRRGGERERDQGHGAVRWVVQGWCNGGGCEFLFWLD